MSENAGWSSQPFDEWVLKYAPGKFINLEGKATHYIEKGQGEPLILIHGFFFDTNMWQRNIDALAEHFKVFAFDLWGFGYSTRQPLQYSYALYAQQLKLFMEALGISRAHLMGQSMGGGTIMSFSAGNAERVNKIVLVDPAGMPVQMPILARTSELPIVGEILYYMPGNFVRRMTLRTTFLHRGDLITDDFFESVTRFQKIERSNQIMLSITRSGIINDFKDGIDAFAGMGLPVLIVWGRQEKAIPLEVGQELHQMVEGSSLEVIDQAGHCPNLDQPDRFNQVALEFLRS